jgi:alpha-beta hydrolase superfamily lysophospholipase
MAEPLTEPIDALEPTSRGSMTGSDATALAFARWEHPAPRGRVVIAHGYGEHGERYQHTAHALLLQGWSVSSLDHKGFGRSGGVRGDARGIKAPVEDLTLFLRQERMHDAARAGTGPVPPMVLLGHSFGGLLALLVLLWHPETLDALVVSSPALRLRELPRSLRALQRLLYWLAPHRPLQVPSDKSRVCSDPDLVERYRADPFCHRFVSAAFVEAMLEGRRELLDLGAELDRPILLLEADQDTVIDPDGAEPLWTAIRPGLLSRHRLAGFYHEILHDRGRAEAERLIAQWLDARFPVREAEPALASPRSE